MTLEVVPHFLGSVDARSIDVGLAGTVMRFLPPVAGLTHGDVMFDGDRAARRRGGPRGDFLRALTVALIVQIIQTLLAQVNVPVLVVSLIVVNS